MRYVSLERTRDGIFLDPEAYLEQLPSLADSLPDGARRFATEPGHYDFFGQRCGTTVGSTRKT